MHFRTKNVFSPLKSLKVPVVVVITLLIQCSRVNKEPSFLKEVPVRIRPEFKTETLKMSDLYEVIKYLPLQTNEDCIFGNITKLIVRDHFFWIFDDLTNSIFCFDEDGNFKFKISKEGKGPGEYIKINDFIYYDKCIYVLDVGSGKILVYDNSGEFKFEIRERVYSTSFEKMDENFVFYLAFMQNERYKKGNQFQNFIITDSLLRKVNAFLPFSKEIAANTIIRSPRNLQRYGQEVLIWQPLDNRIYLYNNHLLTAKYKIDFGEENEEIQSAIMKQVSSPNWNAGKTEELMGQFNYCSIIDLVDTESFLHFIYRQNEYFHFVFFIKGTGKVIDLSARTDGNSSPVPLINDIDGVLHYPLLTSSSDTVYSYANAYELIVNNHENPGIKNSLTENSNPVIVFIKMKPQNL